MGNLYFFNPENDLALAADSPHFTPPKAALALQSAGASLPGLICNDGDSIIATGKDYDWLERLHYKFDIPDIVKDWVTNDIISCRPWGWSKYTRQKFLNLGIDANILPNNDQLNNIRSLSHRRLTIDILNFCRDTGLPYSLHDLPVEIADCQLINNRLNKEEHIYIKSPWSGSGRGIVDSKSAPARQILRLAEGVIKHQGSVMVEKALDKIADFAMLFTMENGKARFEGYSYFYNSGYSAYSGNILLSDNDIIAELSRYVPSKWLSATREAIGQALEQIIDKRYVGPVGVDMLIYRAEHDYLIAPCIECNLRMTMGKVAHTIYQRYIHSDSTGHLKNIQITPNSVSELANAFEKATIRDGKLVSGTIALTPPSGNTFCIVITAEKK